MPDQISLDQATLLLQAVKNWQSGIQPELPKLKPTQLQSFELWVKENNYSSVNQALAELKEQAAG